jgi:hypothetical protein
MKISALGCLGGVALVAAMTACSAAPGSEGTGTAEEAMINTYGTTCATGWVRDGSGELASAPWHYWNGVCAPGNPALCAIEQQIQQALAANGAVIPSALHYMIGAHKTHYSAVEFASLQPAIPGTAVNPTNLFNQLQSINSQFAKPPVSAALTAECRFVPGNPDPISPPVTPSNAIETWDPTGWCKTCETWD